MKENNVEEKPIGWSMPLEEIGLKREIISRI